MDFNYFNNIISQKQYFPKDLFALNNNECFVDGGAYDGATILDFINEVNNKYKFIYAFEPDHMNFTKLSNEFLYMNDTKVKLYNAGLYSKTGSISFCSNGNSSSFISEKGEFNIQVVRGDDVIKKYKPTYIKLDIEGSEQEAICGMKNIIIENHPKLAISIYHKQNDLWDIPLLIHNIENSYKLYIRHYLNCLNETVCYAV
ncbi:FkbM family methyltransferase [Clostridium tyrobutyricum]|jgi:FkbM family methyltransferase|nr:FkbM family methyltransferase [Clostridium tyrobutyricum]